MAVSVTEADAARQSGISNKSHEENIETRREVDSTGSHSEDEASVTPKTWLVVFILSMGYGLSFWPIPVVANIGSQVAAELNDPSGVIWFIPAWTLSITVCFMIAGANTDLLGRRWFLVGGNFICVIGHIVVGTSKTSSAFIAGMAISGFGAANCQMAAFALSELLPNKWRHIGVVLADSSTVIAVVVAPVSARFGIEFGTWRWNFYVAAILQFLSFLGLVFLYFPPAHPLGLPFRTVIKELDYLGMFLFTAGAIPTLVGIVYTTVFPGKDAHVLAPLLIGILFLIMFGLWETYGNIKHPLTPTYVFTAGKGRDLTAPCIALAVVNMFYYSSSILWPTMINVFYTNGGVDWRYGVLLSTVQGIAITTGGVALAVFGGMIKRWHWQLSGSVFIMVLFGVLLALGNPGNKGLMIAFVFISQGAYGWAIYLSIAISQMGVEHKNLGLSGGLSGAARFAGGSIAAAVYTTIITNTVTKWTARLVPVAAINAGLASSDLTSLFSVLGTPAFATTYSPEIVAAVGGATQQAYVHGVQVLGLASLAFGMVGLIASLCCRDVDSKMNNNIETFIAGEEEKAHHVMHTHEEKVVGGKEY